MDTTSPDRPTPRAADRATRITDLAGLDPADAPGPAAELARDLARELESLEGAGDPEQLRAAFDDDTGSD